MFLEEAFNCMDTCHHLDRGQFFITADASCSFAYQSLREGFERAKLIEILKFFDFFLMSVSKGIFGL